MSDARSAALRRYPAMSYLAGACALALLLPSGLTLPQSGPSTLAELAPVPGQGQGQGDLSELGSAGSNGLGSGAGGGGGGATTTTVVGDDDGGTNAEGGRLVRRPGSKNCVGNPPRQTEDPLSPPCVAFFDGDNGGATAKGVTRDEVTVLVKLNNANTDQREGEIVDCAEAPDSEDTFEDVLCKAYHRYFNERYQTYGRRIHLHAVHNGFDVPELDERFHPFASVAMGAESEWARRGTLSVGYIGVRRAHSRLHAPRLISFRADLEDQMAQIATYVCSKLAGRPARYAGDPRMHGTARTFGFLFTDRSRKDEIKAAVRDHCGVDITAETGDWQTATGVASLQTRGVTTVITVVGNTAHAAASNYATQIGFFPEWFVPGDAGIVGLDINLNGRTANQAQWSNAFGLTFDYRRGAVPEQPWYRAYREGCPRDAACPEPQLGQQGVVFAPAAYDALTMLFYGIQAAGPRLTHDNVDRGLHAIEPRPSNDPFRPAAYFGPGNYSFIKDAMAIHWDATGTPPGSPSAGCWRLPYEGRRFRAGEWRPGDDDVKGAGPCQADTFQ